MASDNQSTLYIVYNAKSTLLGKVDYIYRKANCPDSVLSPACAACELTHGPSLRLTETPEWKATKACIQHATVVQVHTDERPEELTQWMKQASVSLPAVLVEATQPATENHFRVLLTSEDLARVRLDHAQFLEMLQSRITEMGIAGIEVKTP